MMIPFLIEAGTALSLNLLYRMWREAAGLATQREAGQPIGSGSSASERAKIIRTKTSPLMSMIGIDLKCMDFGPS
jgi:hypothetical protein